MRKLLDVMRNNMIYSESEWHRIRMELNPVYRRERNLTQGITEDADEVPVVVNDIDGGA